MSLLFFWKKGNNVLLFAIAYLINKLLLIVGIARHEVNQHLVAFTLAGHAERFLHVLQVKVVRNQWLHVHVPAGHDLQCRWKAGIITELRLLFDSGLFGDSLMVKSHRGGNFNLSRNGVHHRQLDVVVPQSNQTDPACVTGGLDGNPDARLRSSALEHAIRWTS